ncbi:MAG TPA: hypothetical protein LFW21_01745 [Rickettsia endosymbiont of Pyrocoelia pectoralis]|nr:hypothetical protein [Rickettsia endosymbiont of Pyrocoelia pectoralis]
MKQEIISKAMTLLGSNSGNSTSKAENLCDQFINASIEEVFLSIKWDFALKKVDKIEADTNDFKAVPTIKDCLRIAVIVPSNLEFYVELGVIYFKGGNLTSLFYFSGKILELLLNNDGRVWGSVPQNFKLLTALALSSKVAFALYSDSLFADGLKKQYLIHLEQAKRIYSIGYNIVNSGEV